MADISVPSLTLLRAELAAMVDMLKAAGRYKDSPDHYLDPVSKRWKRRPAGSSLADAKPPAGASGRGRAGAASAARAATPEVAKHDVHGALDRMVQANSAVAGGHRHLQDSTKSHVWDHQSSALALLLHHTPVEAIRHLHPSHLQVVRNTLREGMGLRTLQRVGKQWGVPKHNPLHGRRHVLEHIAGPGNAGASANEGGVSARQHLTRELLKHAKMPDHVRAKVAEHMENAAASAEQDKQVGPSANHYAR